MSEGNIEAFGPEAQTNSWRSPVSLSGQTWRTSVPPEARRRSIAPVVRGARRPHVTQPATPVKRPVNAPAKKERTDPAVARLIAEYTPLVHKIVGGFQRRLPRNVLREDLVAAGMAGLWDAIRRHGEKHDEGFEWYVRVRVRGAILDELRAQDWLSRRARRAAAATGDSMPPRVVRLDDVGEWEQNRCLATSPEAESEYTEQLVRDHLAKAVETLPERERLIVSEHYFNHVKFKSLGERLGVSEPRISQLHSRAMQRLRSAVAEQNI
ncbi:MAG TPA: sigma-70 family RNA polymerase sigma factor [Polyangiaceae bacterium]|nr:sigma-70 family RNA polymerase sigma factor [Polyangiaceae bacterium]